MDAFMLSPLQFAAAESFGTLDTHRKLFPWSIDPAYNLAAMNASSSPLTLKIMLIVVIIFVPIAPACRFWTYKLFSGKVAEDDLSYEDA